MLTITEPARDRLSQKLARKSSDEGVALRLTHGEGCWQLRPDEARADDTIFRHEGKSFLLVDRGVLSSMKDMILDVRMTKAGPRLRFRKSPVQGG